MFVKTNAAEFELRPDQCLKLLRTLYGLCESGDLRYETFAEHCKGDLKLQSMRSDQALRYLKDGRKSHEFCGAYVDDLLSAGDEVFKQRMKLTRENF